MKKRLIGLFGIAMLALMTVSIHPGSKACADCNQSEPGVRGCICFCERYANDTAYDDQYGTHTWEEQFWYCFDANGCEYDTMAAPEERERNLQKPQFNREPRKTPVPLRDKP